MDPLAYAALVAPYTIAWWENYTLQIIKKLKVGQRTTTDGFQQAIK